MLSPIYTYIGNNLSLISITTVRKKIVSNPKNEGDAEVYSGQNRPKKSLSIEDAEDIIMKCVLYAAYFIL